MTEQLMYAEINVVNVVIMGIIALRHLAVCTENGARAYICCIGCFCGNSKRI